MGRLDGHKWGQGGRAMPGYTQDVNRIHVRCQTEAKRTVLPQKWVRARITAERRMGRKQVAGEGVSKNDSSSPTQRLRCGLLFVRGAREPCFQEPQVSNASLLVPGASSPEDPGGTCVIKNSTAPQAQHSLGSALHLLKLPAIRHGRHHLRELLLLTLKHTVHVLHRHL